MKTVYKISKQLHEVQGHSQDIPVKAKDGSIITEERTKLERLKEHFQEILNQPDPLVVANITEAVEHLDINVGEITDAIQKLKNGKAPGEYGICPEMLKVEDKDTPHVLQNILQDIWNSETAPDDWKTGIIIKLPKKGKLEDYFKQAFDRLHRNSLWMILKHYGIPKNLVNMIQSLYRNFECCGIHNNELTKPFMVETGVKQGRIMSPLLFSLAIDWVMRCSTKGKRR
ncbi:uncharacterized protein LOC144359464 [Saccoglossus kowalevskii]